MVMEGISVLYYLMIAFGLFLIVAAIANWEWYFKQRRAQSVVKAMGRTGARWLYGLLGLFFAVFAYLVLGGYIQV